LKTGPRLATGLAADRARGEKEELVRAQSKAEEKSEEVADLERKT